MIKKRRKHPRLRIPLEAEYLVAGREEWRQGTIWTLGAGGAALLCDEKLEPGTALEGLRFVIEAEDDLPEIKIEVSAEVVNIDRKPNFGRSANFMLSLQFSNLGEEEFELLRQFVFRRLTASQEATGEGGVPAAKPQKTLSAPIEVRFKLFEEFVSEVSDSLSPSGMFIRAHKPLPPGSRFVFQFRLGDDFALFRGTAEVVWTRRQNEGLDRPPGMGVRFLKLDLTSQKLVKRLLTERGAAKRKPDEERVGDAPTAADGDAPVDVAATAEPAVGDDPQADSASEPEAQQEAAPEKRPSRRQVRLEKRLSKMKSARDEAEERAKRFAGEAKELQKETQALQASLDSAEEARGSAEAQVAELRLELESSQPDEELEERLTSAREELERARTEWQNLESELRSTLEEQVERADRAEGELDGLREESTDSNREWNALESELRDQLEQRTVEIAELEDRVAEATTAETRLGEELSEACAARDAAEEQLAQRATTEAELRAGREGLEAKLTQTTERLGKMRSVADEMRTRFNGDLTAAQELGTDLESRLTEVAELGQGLDRKVERLTTARTALTERLARITEAWSSLEGELEAVEPEDVESEAAGDSEQPAADVEGEAAAGFAGAEEAPDEPPVEAVAEANPLEEPPTGAAEEEPAGVDLAEVESELLDVAPEGAWEELPVSSAADYEDGATPDQDTEEDPEPVDETVAPEPTGAARLFGAARRAVARLSFGRQPGDDDGSESDADLETADQMDDRLATPDELDADLEMADEHEVEPTAEAESTAEDERRAEAETEAESAAAEEVSGTEAIEETVRAWAAAWSERRVEDYLSFYSREFEPDRVEEDDEDATEAPRGWMPPLAGMELSLGPISQTELAPGRFAVHFEQRVESDSYSRRTGRTLEMVLEADAWKIAAERFQDLAG